ncbi:hypothetical protein ABZZ79_32030 [Streptomyces sp. NPDC006458]|uniref:hypothetical protein n=1 Tax=Streptomyces sp. NPDC006458 TaxID=3154302 RepID=UPI0033B66A9F
MDGYQVYRDAMTKDQWQGWWVTWPLSTRVRLGHVYDRKSDGVRRAGDLAARGIPFQREHGTPDGTFIYDSNESVDVAFKASGKTPAALSALTEADAGASVTFTRGRTAFVVFREYSQSGISDVRGLSHALVSAWWNKEWDDSLLAVTSVVAAAGATVLTAAEGGAVAELKVSASAGVGELGMADLALGASVVRHSALGAQWTGTDVTPFYQVIRLRKNWLGKIVAEYGPRPPGRGALPSALPPLLSEEIGDDPEAALEPGDRTEELPFHDPENE